MKLVLSVLGATILALSTGVGGLIVVMHSQSAFGNWLMVALTFCATVAYGLYCWEIIDAWQAEH